MAKANVIEITAEEGASDDDKSGSADASATKRIIDLTNMDARRFLLKSESYCNFDLPEYFNFDAVLLSLDTGLNGKNLSDMWNAKPRDFDDINYKVLNNKDGRYAWRPMQLIHPALYVSLVHKITEEAHWKTILNRFKEFSKNSRIECISLPLVSAGENSDKAEQVLNWWHEVEQKSIELSLDYECMIQTDVTDCYGAIYTHSIAWSIHDKAFVKQAANRNNKNLIGNIIDTHLQDMAHAQTNGIPQGSTLMDFIAEMVLGYADFLLTQKIGDEIKDYYIIRYRDDYRIFVNNPRDGEKIVRYLTEVMIGLNLKLSAEKTKISNQVIKSSIKADKIFWLRQKQSERNLQKHLLIVHGLSLEYPNSGSLVKALQGYYDRLYKIRKYSGNVIPLISIIVDIAHNNPRTYPFAAAILSLLLAFIEQDNQKTIIVDKIRKKFDKIPNTGHLEIWLQRITLGFKTKYPFEERLCKIVDGDDVNIWNNSWLKDDLKKRIDDKKIVNTASLDKLPEIITRDEISLFKASFDSGI